MVSVMKSAIALLSAAACLRVAAAAQWHSNAVAVSEMEKSGHKLMRRAAGSAAGAIEVSGGVDVHGEEGAHGHVAEVADVEQEGTVSAEDGQSSTDAQTGTRASEVANDGAETVTDDSEEAADEDTETEAKETRGKEDKEDVGLLFCNTGNDASPGTPKIEGLSIAMKEQNASIAALGDRLLKAADGAEAAKTCGSFYSFGDFVWCNKAMPLDSEFAKNNLYGGAYCNVSTAAASLAQDEGSMRGYVWMDGSVKATRELNNGNIEGLSYGIGENDPWSEMMSSMFWLSTRLYDCNNNSKTGPFVQDMRGTHNRDSNPCTERHCYTVGYEKNLICLADREETVDGRRYLPLHNAIENRPPMSALIKIDVEGNEWGVLDQLTKTEADLAAIRSLDVKLNFAAQSSVPLDRRVEIVEELASKFAVTGSTIEPLFKNLKADFDKDRSKDASYMRGPSVMYASSGFPLDQFSMSFVNRKLL
eukprot:TRINITY_DN101979_c0_g1_i1.p1 TRINITY_DN101979_c0_g1~~TRINITY_DN101979_c0_g1_i1.p1  ORF type:complete len:476 (-),score=105.22 TRINITY_DN101979_c0_g1_i1:68-1495(-)